MGFLDQLLGNDDQRGEQQDFVRRYDEGAPYDGISTDEATSRYGQVSAQLSPDQYQQAAQDAFANLSPDERVAVGQHLEQQAGAQGYQWAGGDSQAYSDPATMAQLTTDLHQQRPGLLGELMGGGGGGGGGLGGLLGGGGGGGAGKGLLAGIAASALKRAL